MVAAHAAEGRVELALWLRGVVFGFAVAAPVGPIGLLCIQRTLVSGRAAGLAAGLGAATADALYGAVAAFGLTAVAGLLVGGASGVRLAGGLLLLALGVRTFLAAPATQAAAPTPVGLLGIYGATLLLTLANPATLLGFAAVFAGLGLAGATGGWRPALALVLGVFSGSALWWVLLAGGVGLVRGRLTPSSLRWVNRTAGALVVGFGLIVLLTLR